MTSMLRHRGSNGHWRQRWQRSRRITVYTKPREFKPIAAKDPDPSLGEVQKLAVKLVCIVGLFTGPVATRDALRVKLFARTELLESTKNAKNATALLKWVR
jgi:hypothetical protein